MNMEDAPTDEKAKAAETAKKMAQKVADARERGGVRASTWGRSRRPDGRQ